MAAKQGSRGLIALWKQGWMEIPEVMGSLCMAAVGTAMASYAIYNWEIKQGPYNRRYKQHYIVIRDDDPRVKDVRKD